MSFENNEFYYISAGELSLLLAAAGLEVWYGIPLPDQLAKGEVRTDQERVHQVLARLYQKGYVNWDEHKIRLEEPVSSLVKIIRDATECTELVPMREEEAPLLVYLAGDRCALLEESLWDKGTYRFGLWDKGEVDAFLTGRSRRQFHIKRTLLDHGRDSRRGS